MNAIAVAGAAEVQAFTIKTTGSVNMVAMGTRQMGAAIASARLQMTPWIPDLSVTFDMFAGNATFQDGAKTFVANTNSMDPVNGLVYAMEVPNGRQLTKGTCHTIVFAETRTTPVDFSVPYAALAAHAASSSSSGTDPSTIDISGNNPQNTDVVSITAPCCAGEEDGGIDIQIGVHESGNKGQPYVINYGQNVAGTDAPSPIWDSHSDLTGNKVYTHTFSATGVSKTAEKAKLWAKMNGGEPASLTQPIIHKGTLELEVRDSSKESNKITSTMDPPPKPALYLAGVQGQGSIQAGILFQLKDYPRMPKDVCSGK